MKQNFKVAFPKEKNDPPLVQEVLSEGGFIKPAPGAGFMKSPLFFPSLK